MEIDFLKKRLEELQQEAKNFEMRLLQISGSIMEVNYWVDKHTKAELEEKWKDANTKAFLDNSKENNDAVN